MDFCCDYLNAFGDRVEGQAWATLALRSQELLLIALTPNNSADRSSNVFCQVPMSCPIT